MNNITEKEFYWLVGLLEGEGSFMKGSPSKPNNPKITIEMTDRDIVEKVAKIFNRACTPIKARKVKWKQTFSTKLTGKRAIDLMVEMKPFLSNRRQEQINNCINSYNPDNYKQRWAVRMKITNEVAQKANISIQNKEKSLRQAARELGVNHETLRQRIKKINGAVA